MLQVLVDADNVDPVRTAAVLDALPAYGGVIELVVAGHPRALARVSWPAYADVREAQGWQHADVVLAGAYRPGSHPLVLVSGDGDFALLVARHHGPVLVVSEAPSARLRGELALVDPVVDGLDRLRDWFAAVTPGSGCL